MFSAELSGTLVEPGLAVQHIRFSICQAGASQKFLPTLLNWVRLSLPSPCCRPGHKTMNSLLLHGAAWQDCCVSKHSLVPGPCHTHPKAQVPWGRSRVSRGTVPFPHHLRKPLWFPRPIPLARQQSPGEAFTWFPISHAMP